jgi:maltooligosyltrehalose synthase
VGLQRKGGWGDDEVTLPDGSFRDALTGARYAHAAPLAQLFKRYPVALLLLEPTPR